MIEVGKGELRTPLVAMFCFVCVETYYILLNENENVEVERVQLCFIEGQLYWKAHRMDCLCSLGRQYSIRIKKKNTRLLGLI